MRALNIAVVVMGVLIVVGVVALGIVIAQRMSAASAPIASVTLDEPPGTRIAGASAGADRLAVQLAGGGPDRVVLVDLRSGRVLGHVALAR